MTAKDELLAALWAERHNGIAWANETRYHAETEAARALGGALDVDRAEDDELQAPRRRRLMANDFERANKKEAG